jgi:hypothetical protein
MTGHSPDVEHLRSLDALRRSTQRPKPPRGAGRRVGSRPGDRARGEDDGELLADLAVAGVEDHVPGVGVDANQASEVFSATFS